MTTPDMLPDRYAVTSEDEAFALLERLVAGAVAPHGFEVRLDGWPRFVIVIKGRDFDGTLPTRIMPILLELQRQVHRLYSHTVYGSDNLRRLSRQDKEDLELLVRVEKGSSFFETLLNEPLFNTLRAAVDKMTPEQVTITVIVFALAATSLIGWKMWLRERSKALDLDHDLKMSQLENERMVILARAVQQVPLAGLLAEGIDPLRHNIAAKLQTEDRLEVPADGGRDLGTQPVIINGVEAEQLTRSPREVAMERLIEDDFLLLAADFSKPGVVRVELQRLHDAYAFRADVPAGVLDNDQERALRDRSWERQTLRLSVLVRELHQRYTGAKVVAVREP